MTKAFDYHDFTSRNKFYISDELQQKIKATTILLAGCGLGSQIAIQAARTGFEKFIVADGDNVEVSNLNRQGFLIEHINTNKAEATTKLIKAINPDCTVEFVPFFIDRISAPGLIEKADYIINTIDVDSDLFVLFNRYSIELGKSILFPLNLGWGGTNIIFTPKSATLEEMLNIEESDLLFPEIIKKKLFYFLLSNIKSSDYLLKVFNEYENSGETWSYLPQIGVGAELTASLCISAIVRMLGGLQIKTAPFINRFDLWTIND